jgi:hypothetical protein
MQDALWDSRMVSWTRAEQFFLGANQLEEALRGLDGVQLIVLLLNEEHWNRYMWCKPLHQ